MASSKGKSFITFAILGLLILALAGFGVTEFGGSVRSVVTVGKAEVETVDYQRAIQAQLQQLQQRTGQPITFQQARAFGVDQIALGQLITAAALEDEAASIGLSVGDTVVGERIQQSGGFRNASGEFDRAIYEASLRQNGSNSGEFEDRMRSDIAEGLLQSAVSAGVRTSDVYIDTLYNYARETRDVSWLRLGASDLTTPIGDPTNSELTAYHTENAEAFTRPETKRIRYALLTTDMLVDQIEVEEPVLRAAYDARITEFVQPERRLVERLVFLSDEQATEAKARLDAEELTFDELVEERGLTLAAIDLGDLPEDELGAAAADIFALAEPGVVGPLPSDLGPALYRMNGILAARETTFDDAREQLRDAAAQDRARRLILDTQTQVADLLAGGADVTVLAERTEMIEESIEWNVETVDGISAEPAFRTAVSAAQPGDFAEVTQLANGIAVIVVDEVLDPALRPLDDIRAEVTEAWTSAATEDALVIQAEGMAEQIRRDSEFLELGILPETTTGMTRTDFTEGTPPDFSTAAFEMEEGDMRVLSADGDAWLIRVNTITKPDATAPAAAAEREQFADQTASELANGISTAYSQALIDEAGFEVNQTAINAVHSHLP